jgi:hypothetical protein
LSCDVVGDGRSLDVSRLVFVLVKALKEVRQSYRLCVNGKHQCTEPSMGANARARSLAGVLGMTGVDVAVALLTGTARVMAIGGALAGSSDEHKRQRCATSFEAATQECQCTKTPNVSKDVSCLA